MSGSFSIIIPVYNEENSIKELCAEISSACRNYSNYEVIFADDGSTDGTADILAQIPDIRHIRLSNNTGKAGALICGIKNASYETIITMDGDLQDSPSDIPRFLEKLAEGYDVISGYRIIRRDKFYKLAFSDVYNQLMRRLSQSNLHDFNCGYKAFTRHAAELVLSRQKNHRFFLLEAAKIGLRVGEIEINNRARKYGSSKFSMRKYIIFLKDLSVYLLNNNRL